MLKVFTAESLANEVIAIAAVLLTTAPAAMSQTGAKTGSSGAANQVQPTIEAPIGHRQPRPDQLPSEKDLRNPNDALSKENAALDRKIRGICRGC